MKINDSNPIQQPNIAANGAGAKPTRNQPAARSSNVELTTVSTSSTAELQSLVAGSADVRDSLVADVKLRLAAGEFATQQAAYKTAESILNL